MNTTTVDPSLVRLKSWESDPKGKHLAFKCSRLEDNGLLFVSAETIVTHFTAMLLARRSPFHQFVSRLLYWNPNRRAISDIEVAKPLIVQQMVTNALVRRISEYVSDNPHYDKGVLEAGLNRYGEPLAEAILSRFAEGTPSYHSTHSDRIIDELVSHFGEDSTVFYMADSICADLEEGISPQQRTPKELDRIYEAQAEGVRNLIRQDIREIAAKIEKLLTESGE